MFKQLGWASLVLCVVGSAWAADASGRIRVVIVDGQNNHAWKTTTPFMKQVLEQSGRFTVDVATTPQKPPLPAEPAKADEAGIAQYKAALSAYADAYARYRAEKFQIDFSKYEVVLSNYNGESWPVAVQKALDDNLKSGKLGLVIVHAANNSFGGWKEYNQMIGMGWRGANGGERLFLDESGKEVRVPNGRGDSSGHRYSGEFLVVVRDPEHPITRGMPREWLHARDELYDNMRGPIANVHLLATAFSKGTKVHEPMIWTVSYGQGRVFHTPMGHDLTGMHCVGFVTTLLRGTEWAATGKVTLPIPENFPKGDKSNSVGK